MALVLPTPRFSGPAAPAAERERSAADHKESTWVF